MNPQRNAVLLWTIVLGTFLVFSSCSVFTPVGEAISQQYENTVSYFNAFYNARRLFTEAEDQIRTAQLTLRGKDVSGTAAAIPADARAKLNQVIDKCSNILAFHPSSTYVDDALFLIGKSFYYEGEYVKADRKFAEMIVQYPASDLHMEAELWFVRCKEKLAKLPDALTAADTLMADARATEEREYEVEGRLLAAGVLRRMGQPDRAAEMLAFALERTQSVEQRERIETALGDLHAGIGADSAAIGDYHAAAEIADDIYDSYYANLREAIALRTVGSLRESRLLLERMRGDFRYKEWSLSVLVELGNTLVAEGKTAEAVDAYRLVDTAQVRNEYCARAAFELARLNERSLHDYAEARRYYGRVLQTPLPRLVEESRRKSVAFGRYFETFRKWNVLDSLYRFQSDTLRAVAQRDSVTTPRDTVRRVNIPVIQTIPLTADSVRRAHSIWAQDLGDVFYAELEVPDSAMFWYLRSLQDETDSIRAPRVLYILAELARTNPKQGYVPADERYRQLVEQYPASDYASAARRLMGKQTTDNSADPAEALYREGEALLDSAKYRPAIDRLRRIASRYPGSAYVPKSEFAVAWLYEHRLEQPDSALEGYRRIVAAYPRSVFVPVAARKIAGANARRDSIAADSLRVANARADSLRKATAVPDSLRKNTAVPDSLKKSPTAVVPDTARAPLPKPVVVPDSETVRSRRPPALTKPKPDATLD